MKTPRHPHEPNSPLPFPHLGDYVEYLKFRMGVQHPLRSWYYQALCRQARMAEEGWSPFGNYYEFGVGWGGTLARYIKALKAFSRIHKKDLYHFHIFAFDSFEGLPEKKGLEDDHPMWHSKDFFHSLSEIEEKVSKQGIDLRRGTVHFIEGFFEQTLTPALRDEFGMWPPAIVTIDVDYYSSCRVVLEWLRPILKSGTLFYFDDVWAFHGNPHYGELAAINEFNKSDEDQLTPYPELDMASKVYVYSKRDFEYKRKDVDLSDGASNTSKHDIPHR